MAYNVTACSIMDRLVWLDIAGETQMCTVRLPQVMIVVRMVAKLTTTARKRWHLRAHQLRGIAILIVAWIFLIKRVMINEMILDASPPHYLHCLLLGQVRRSD